MDDGLDEGIFAGLDPATFDTDMDGLKLVAAAARSQLLHASNRRALLRELGLYYVYERYLSRASEQDLPMPEPWVRFFKLLATSPYKNILIKMYRMKFGLE